MPLKGASDSNTGDQPRIERLNQPMTNPKNPDLCRDCQQKPPCLAYSGPSARCADCLDLYRAKRSSNRTAKLQRQAAAIKALGAK